MHGTTMKINECRGLPLHQSAFSIVLNLKVFGVDNC